MGFVQITEAKRRLSYERNVAKPGELNFTRFPAFKSGSQVDGLGNILSSRRGQTLSVFLKETSLSVRNQSVRGHFEITDFVIRVGPFCFILLSSCINVRRWKQLFHVPIVKRIIPPGGTTPWE